MENILYFLLNLSKLLGALQVLVKPKIVHRRHFPICLKLSAVRDRLIETLMVKMKMYRVV